MEELLPPREAKDDMGPRSLRGLRFGIQHCGFEVEVAWGSRICGTGVWDQGVSGLKLRVLDVASKAWLLHL